MEKYNPLIEFLEKMELIDMGSIKVFEALPNVWIGGTPTKKLYVLRDENNGFERIYVSLEFCKEYFIDHLLIYTRNNE